MLWGIYIYYCTLSSLGLLSIGALPGNNNFHRNALVRVWDSVPIKGLLGVCISKLCHETSCNRVTDIVILPNYSTSDENFDSESLRY